MQPTSPNSNNFSANAPRGSIDSTGTFLEGGRESVTSPTSTAACTALLSVDLATENLPAVDTPDACDKAAVR